jgi:formate hydrogenlyase subunit 4
MIAGAALQTAVHVAIALVMPPLLLGVIARTKAIFAGRVGPPILQLYYDLAKLARKGSVFSTTTTWVFRAGPVVGLATALVAVLLVPLGNHGAPIAFTGDLVLFAYLFGLGRFFTVSAALDTGSSFEGMGGAREATFACLAEPALFLGLLVLVRRSASLSLTTMLGPALGSEWAAADASLVLVVVSLVIVLLADERGRAC